MKTFFRLLAKITGWPLQLLLFTRKTYYEDKSEKNRKIKGGAIILSNHTNIMDYMVNLFIYPFRKLYCLIAEVIYNKGPIMRFILSCMGGIKVDRNTKDLSFIDDAVKVLNKGKLLQIFPEGRISETSKMFPFSPSYILIALKSGAPIIPVITDGNYGLFKRVRVIIGKKIYLKDYCNSPNPTKEEIEMLNMIITKKVIDLKNKLQDNKDIEKTRFNIFGKFFFDLGRLLAFSTNLVFRVKVHKKNKKIKIKGRYLIVSNHETYLDPVKLICAFWKRRLRILTADVVYGKGKIRAFFINHVGCVKINRKINDVTAFKTCVNILKDDGALVIFPEGHLSKDGTIDSFKSGAVLMACLTNTPILPVYMKKRKNKFGRTHIYFGEPINFQTTNNQMPSLSQLDELSHQLYDAINELKITNEGNNYGKGNSK